MKSPLLVGELKKDMLTHSTSNSSEMILAEESGLHDTEKVAAYHPQCG